MKHLGDITKISGYTVPIVDCVIGGSPCQDLSVAGKRAGLDGERSGLFAEQIRIVKELRERDEANGNTGVDVRPRYMVWENVSGAFSSHKGEDFRIVLEEIARVKDTGITIPRPSNGKWGTAGCIMGDGWSIAWRVLDSQFWGTSDKPLPQRRRRIALVADFGGQSASEILFVRKSVSGDIEPGKPKGRGTSSDLQGSVGATDRKRRNFAFAIENHPNDSRAKLTEDGIVQTLTSRMGTGGGNVPLVLAFVKSKRAQSKTDNETWKQGGIANTLNLFDQGDVRATNVIVEKNDGHYIVRRLTPLECERLQGYPDHWTDIGDYVETNGKKRRSSDSARYKALENSIALPQWKWILKRLCACYERDATMASLFDGIGGFPYLWEQLNGKGSCLWASEVEEFPIAVTKMRIGD